MLRKKLKKKTIRTIPELGDKIDALGKEMRRGFEKSQADTENLARITQEEFARVNDKFEGLIGEVREEMRSGFDSIHNKIDSFESEVVYKQKSTDAKIQEYAVELHDYEERISKVEKKLKPAH